MSKFYFKETIFLCFQLIFISFLLSSPSLHIPTNYIISSIFQQNVHGKALRLF